MLKLSTISILVNNDNMVLNDIVHYSYNGDHIVFVDFEGKEFSFLAISVDVIDVQTQILKRENLVIDNFSFI